MQTQMAKKPMLRAEVHARALRPLIITALNNPCRPITTGSLIPVTAPLAKPLLGDVAASVSLYPTLLGHNSIRQVKKDHIAVYSNERPAILFSPFFLAPATTHPQGPHAGATGQSQSRLRLGRGRSTW